MKKCTHVKLAIVLVTGYTEHRVINRHVSCVRLESAVL